MLRHRPFVLWGADHLIVLGVLAAGVVLALTVGRRLPPHADDTWRRATAMALGINEGLSWFLATAAGEILIPLQLCDLALFFAIWSLWSPRAWRCELAYFWAMAGSVQAIMTPDLAYGFPDYWWMKFFAGHVGVVLSAVYLAATGRVEATHRSIWRVWAWSNVYVAAAALLNWSFGTNYGYLARKPMQPSLLDYFGPWPWYILAVEVLALASFYVYYAPFVIGRRWARHVT
ncbi:MAG: TIGR02206 family membrane protein [Candidatus Omnitrophica bacterium CG11_big_fil_rev_8_21_14_0_20_63_9]|nr:MAG: TIGR02206 family membrane protein [Candidatus Omnitrophica bacterium CG11_big_fil_rev_8_21_14_0_20_63_9]